MPESGDQTAKIKNKKQKFILYYQWSSTNLSLFYNIESI